MQIETIVGTYGSNTYVLTRGDQVLIIDSGAALADVQAVVSTKHVVAILITHEHFDHLTNCAAYAQSFGASIYGSREVLDNLKYYRSELPSEEEAGVVYPIAQLTADTDFQVIKEDTTLTLGAWSVQVFICQGHSAGSLVYLIDGALFTGDLLFQRGIGNFYMTQGKPHMLASLQRVAQLTFTTAYHGHGASSDYAAQTRNLQVWLKWLAR